ncbi:arginine:ornithine antiporter (APA family) [Plasticicumulans lactativorans]|uniref:Arginine-ornithine antiporter n=2 Tax=Plasticicumulans lactativorans TaxID=1133106 RepID=A0A4R2LDH9_9GAMM|nr:arginine-ornithine antiporter [Plasticicumulans lactativorans]TCO82652.1 arginine:ornithine antiporter (APA family) [Plasticicumulans lactativorans]
MANGNGDAAGRAAEGLGLGALTALVIGSMIGGGIFSLPQNVAASSGAGAVLIGWVITAGGMLTLAFVFQTLANRKPDIDGGVYGYARAGFGDFMGFNTAWGYWISAWLGNVSYMVVLFSAFGYFVPAFGEGNTLPAVLCASALLWGLHFLILRGVKGAAFINAITTVAKLVPIAIFVVLVTLAFRVEQFKLDFWGSPTLGSVLDQVKGMMLVTVWVFIGIEGAGVYSSRARSMRDVGRATVLGFFITLALLVAVSVLAMGILGQAELAQLKNPSMAGVLEKVVGPWGAALINVGLIISVGGALLAWTLLAAELPYLGAKDGTFPRAIGEVNANEAPANALWLTNGLVQVFLIITLFAKGTYLALLSLATSMILVPYLLSAGYALLIAWRSESYAAADAERGKDLLIAAIATLYGIWLLYAAGPQYLLLSALLYFPGIVFYAKARSESGARLFQPFELGIFAVQIAAALFAAWELYSGAVSL